MRFIGLDVHRDFCEVAIVEAERSARRAGSRPPLRRCNVRRELGTRRPGRPRGDGERARDRGDPASVCGHVALANPAAVRGESARRRPTRSALARSRGCSRRAFCPRCGRPIPKRRPFEHNSLAGRAPEEPGPCRAAAQPEGGGRRPAISSAPTGANGWEPSSSPITNARPSRRACATSTFSMSRWRRSSAGSPNAC